MGRKVRKNTKKRILFGTFFCRKTKNHQKTLSKNRDDLQRCSLLPCRDLCLLLHQQSIKQENGQETVSFLNGQKILRRLRRSRRVFQHRPDFDKNRLGTLRGCRWDWLAGLSHRCHHHSAKKHAAVRFSRTNRNQNNEETTSFRGRFFIVQGSRFYRASRVQSWLTRSRVE